MARARTPDMTERTTGLMQAGDWQDGYQAVSPAPVGILGRDRFRTVNGESVRGNWSDPWWMYKPGTGWAISRRWVSPEQDRWHYQDGELITTTLPAADERELTPQSEPERADHGLAA